MAGRLNTFGRYSGRGIGKGERKTGKKEKHALRGYLVALIF